MAQGKIFTSVFVTIMLYIMFFHGKSNVVAASGGSSTSNENAHRVRSRPLFRLAPRPLNQYARLKSEIGDLVVDDDDFFDMNKRQTSDDYGHLRFGKRNEFDDYGHMRFGRAGGDNARE